jgi:hypothetical protein
VEELLLLLFWCYITAATKQATPRESEIFLSQLMEREDNYKCETRRIKSADLNMKRESITFFYIFECCLFIITQKPQCVHAWKSRSREREKKLIEKLRIVCVPAMR